ncbi:MAG: hypothetical protein ACK4P1_12430, partial [Aggregatilineales bacterium]
MRTFAFLLIACLITVIPPTLMPEAARSASGRLALAQLSNPSILTPTPTVAPTLIATSVPNF